MDLIGQLKQYSQEPISRQLLLDMLREYRRPHDKIEELVASGMLVRIRRGLWVAGKQLAAGQPEPFLLANHIMGPSYVSMDAALSYHGLIPESVFEISSVTPKRSKQYHTPVGRFTYTHLPLPYYAFGIRQVSLAADQVVMIASPEKALCDKIVTTSGLLLRSEQQAVQLLTEDLRIGGSELRQLDTSMISSWVPDAPKKESLIILLKTLTRL